MTLARRHVGQRALVNSAGTEASCAFGGPRDTGGGRRTADIMHLQKRTPGASGGLGRVTAAQKKSRQVQTPLGSLSPAHLSPDPPAQCGSPVA
jgi:hypothetical protein